MPADPITREAPRFDVGGKIALVTGAARGLGRACAIALAQSGADVALGLRDARADGGTTEAIRALGRRALPLQMDVTRAAEIAAAVAEAERAFGRIDILVNNAGIGPAQPRRVRHRGRLRSHAGREPERNILRQPGGGTGDDPQRRRAASSTSARRRAPSRCRPSRSTA